MCGQVQPVISSSSPAGNSRLDQNGRSAYSGPILHYLEHTTLSYPYAWLCKTQAASHVCGCCSALSSTNRIPLAITSYLHHSLHEHLTVSSSSLEHISTHNCLEMSLLDTCLIQQMYTLQLLYQDNQAVVCCACLCYPATSVSQTATSACLQLPATLTCWSKMPLTHC